MAMTVYLWALHPMTHSGMKKYLNPRNPSPIPFQTLIQAFYGYHLRLEDA